MQPKLLISDAALPIIKGFFDTFSMAKKNVDEVARNIQEPFQHDTFYGDLKA